MMHTTVQCMLSSKQPSLQLDLIRVEMYVSKIILKNEVTKEMMYRNEIDKS